MSKCWYCNNELTIGDSLKHFGICNKCYDEMFKSGDTIIRSLTNKITDLEAKIKALQNGIIDDETLNMLVKEHKLYKDLEAKLAESAEQLKEELEEKNGVRRALSACNRQNDEFADMIKKLVNEKEELKQQLDKKEREIAYMTKQAKKFNNEAQKYYEDAYCNDFHNQDKISLAVYELSLVNGMLTDAIIELTQNETDANKLYYLEKIAKKFAEKTGGRINELKEMK